MTNYGEVTKIDSNTMLESDTKNKQPFMVDWVDSVRTVVSDKGDTVELGTVLAVCNNFVCLQPLSNEQLLELRRVVSQAVDYELSKRKTKPAS